MAILIAALPAARADTLMIVKEGSRMAAAGGEELPGESAEAFGSPEKLIRYWSRDDRLARIDDGSRIISRMDRRATYMLNEQTRACSEIAYGEEDTSGDSRPDSGFRKTGETRQIGSWQADRYVLTVASDADEYDVDLWVSDEVAVDTDGHRAYLESVTTPVTAWMLETFELGGYPVRQEFRMGPIVSWAELVSVEEKTAPPGTYEIPDGYSGCE